MGSELSLTHVAPQHQKASAPPGQGLRVHRLSRPAPVADPRRGAREERPRPVQPGRLRGPTPRGSDAHAGCSMRRRSPASCPSGSSPASSSRSERNATAGRLVIELGRHAAPGELERRLRTVLRDPTLAVLHWSDAAGAYLDVTGKPAPLPAEGDRRGVTYLERQGRPMTALVHDPKVLDDAGLSETVLAAVRFVVEKERLHGQIQATSIDAAALPSGFVTLLMTDIEASTALLRRLGDGYGALLNDVRSIVRRAVSQGERPRDRCASRRVLRGLRSPARPPSRQRWPSSERSAPAPGRMLWRCACGSGFTAAARRSRTSGTSAWPSTPRPASARPPTGGRSSCPPTTRTAAGQSAPAGVRFRSLGRHRLPGLPDAETLFQIQAPGLRLRFPPPRISRRSAPRHRPQGRQAGRGDRMGPGQLELPELR